MKTNVVMVRKLKDFDIFQRTKDGFFNATGLLQQWNKLNRTKKEITKFFELDQTKAFLEVLTDEEGLHTQESAYVKSRASRGKNAGTWMHPILFIKFAMWINPRFEYFVIKFVYDQLIEYRHNAGDMNVHFRSRICRHFNPDADFYMRINRGLNCIIKKIHYQGIRNFMTENELKDLENLQNWYANALDMGLIKSKEQLIKLMIKEYNRRHTPRI